MKPVVRMDEWVRWLYDSGSLPASAIESLWFEGWLQDAPTYLPDETPNETDTTKTEDN